MVQLLAKLQRRVAFVEVGYPLDQIRSTGVADHSVRYTLLAYGTAHYIVFHQ